MSNDVIIAFAKSSDRGEHRDKQLLSEREQEIVQLVVQGYTNNHIAEMLFINDLTVKDDLHGIFNKLAVSDRLELALYTIHDRLRGQSCPHHPEEQLSSFSLDGWMRSVWVWLRRKL
jgi:DNA-binding NarL/FixJ family response regulator